MINLYLVVGLQFEFKLNKNEVKKIFNTFRAYNKKELQRKELNKIQNFILNLKKRNLLKNNLN